LQPLELAPGIFKYIQLKKLSKAIVQSAWKRRPEGLHCIQII
jgi:hypothetical protein